MNGIFHDERCGLNIYNVTVGTARVFYADVSGLCIDDVRDNLSEQRILKIDALKRDIDKKLSAGAELLLNVALSKYYPQIKTPVRYQFGKFKKPGIAGFADVYFNMSHAGSVAVCAVADTQVGVDIELSDRMSEATVNKYFTDSERQFLKCNPDSGFAYIWTRKEALVKAEGTGLSFGLASFSVVDDIVNLSKESYKITSIKPEISGYELALCERLVSENTP